MGQYYHPTLLNEKKDEILASTIGWDWGMGAKLMETAWVGNSMVNAVEQLLAGKYKGARVVWAGDYSETPFKEKENLYMAVEEKNVPNVTELAKAVSYKEDTWEYKRVDYVKFKFVINLDKEVAVPIPEETKDTEDWQIHPLPLLTADGNGKGGGDYWSEINADYVGTWAYDRIKVGNEVPDGFKVLNIKFEE